MMPEMSGLELHAAIARTSPAQAERMAFMSGGAFTPDTVRQLHELPNPRIDKPFRPAALRELLNRTLAGATILEHS